MVEISVIESCPALLPLSTADEQLLRELNESLASRKSWWGSEDEASESRPIQIIRLGSDFSVCFRDVIGVVRLESVQIRIAPKIPLDHFEHVVSYSSLAPRLAERPAIVSEGAGFEELVAHWFLRATETLIRRGLRSDYRLESAEQDALRGSLHLLETANNLALGRLLVSCEFEDLSVDQPLNRILRAASERIFASRSLASTTRQAAARLVFRMEEVGALRPSDLQNVQIDRLTHAYAPSIPLARLILAGAGITLAAGAHVGSAFLVRTPELVEDGLRRLLQTKRAALQAVKRKLVLGNSGISLNPDLIMQGGRHVGDVKYRFVGKNWDRGSLNQIVTFATGFRATKACLVAFQEAPSDSSPPRLTIGSVVVGPVLWPVHQSPDQAEDMFLSAMDAWTRVSTERGS